MTEEKAKSQSWWQTVPGLLTGLAAVITAITGLIIALHRTGDVTDSSKTAAQTSAVTRSMGSGPVQSQRPGSNSTAPTAAPNTAVARSLRLPAGMEVKLAGGSTVIKILSAELEPFSPEKRAVKFVVRHTNNGRYPANLWGDSYRLIVDDVTRAPTNFLNEIVPAESAKEGVVVFEVPATVTAVLLQISSGEEKSRLRFDLTAAQP